MSRAARVPTRLRVSDFCVPAGARDAWIGGPGAPYDAQHANPRARPSSGGETWSLKVGPASSWRHEGRAGCSTRSRRTPEPADNGTRERADTAISSRTPSPSTLSALAVGVELTAVRRSRRGRARPGCAARRPTRSEGSREASVGGQVFAGNGPGGVRREDLVQVSAGRAGVELVLSVVQPAENPD